MTIRSDARMRFARLLDALRHDDQPGFALAELNDLLSGLASGELCCAIEHAEEPRFATPLAGLRLHLLRSAPVPFKRRNIFIDSSIGDRV